MFRRWKLIIIVDPSFDIYTFFDKEGISKMMGPLNWVLIYKSVSRKQTAVLIIILYYEEMEKISKFPESTSITKSIVLNSFTNKYHNMSFESKLFCCNVSFSGTFILIVTIYLFLFLRDPLSGENMHFEALNSSTLLTSLSVSPFLSLTPLSRTLSQWW